MVERAHGFSVRLYDRKATLRSTAKVCERRSDQGYDWQDGR